MIIDELLHKLPLLSHQHARTTDVYNSYVKEIRGEIESLFHPSATQPIDFSPFGKITFPYFNMGNRNSLDLFDLDELIIFSFYWVNRHRYKKVLDIGANIGLHSLILAKCGFQVHSFEPDPIHFQQLKSILAMNQIKNVTPHAAAVSNQPGKAQFVRVLGNTTASHLAGSKQSYGELEEYPVPLASIRDLIQGVDLIKMDVEGHEDVILLATNGNDWNTTDAIVEVGSFSKAEAIYDHFKKEEGLPFCPKNQLAKGGKTRRCPR